MTLFFICRSLNCDFFFFKFWCCLLINLHHIILKLKQYLMNLIIWKFLCHIYQVCTNCKTWSMKHTLPSLAYKCFQVISCTVKFFLENRYYFITFLLRMITLLLFYWVICFIATILHTSSIKDRMSYNFSVFPLW